MTQKSSSLALILMLAAAVLGMALVFYATTYGPGVGGDATIYLTTARNLAQGQGLGWVEADGSYRVLPYFPPFYPLTLSFLSLFVSDLVSGARWLNIFLFGATVALVGWAFYRASGRPWLAAVLAGVLATSPVLLGVSVWAMSEPIFLFTGFSGLILLLAYFENPRWTTLLLSALLVGMSFIARYIGAAFVGTAGLALLIFLLKTKDRAFWQKLLGYAVIAGLPMLFWLVVDFSLTGTVGSRSAQPASAYWQRLVAMCPALEDIYLFWLLPESVANRLPAVIRTALWLVPLLAVVVGGAWIYRRLREVLRIDTRLLPAARLAGLMALFVIVFLLVLTVVQVFTYPPITLASRMLSPVHLAVMVLLFALAHLAWSLWNPNSRLVGGVVYLVVLALLGTYALRGALVARDYHQTGIGYTSPVWSQADILEKVRSLPPEVPLITNETTALMFLVNRSAYTLHEIFQDHPLETFTVYGEGEDESQRVFREEGGALILFNETLASDFAMYGERVDERLEALTSGLYLYYQGEAGSIYFSSQPAFLSVEQ